MTREKIALRGKETDVAGSDGRASLLLSGRARMTPRSRLHAAAPDRHAAHDALSLSPLRRTGLLCAWPFAGAPYTLPRGGAWLLGLLLCSGARGPVRYRAGAALRRSRCPCRYLALRETSRPPARCLRSCWARSRIRPPSRPESCLRYTLARHKRPLGVCAYHTGRAKYHDLKSPGKPVDVWSLLYNQVYRTRLLLCIF